MSQDKRELQLIVRLSEMILLSAVELDLESFVVDDVIVDATAFRLQHIGEAAGRLSPQLQARHPEAPWPAMVRMRHILAHAYEQVAPDILWRVVEEDLRPLLAICDEELARNA